MSIIKYLSCTWKGADPALLLRLYRALIRSRSEYGASLFTLTAIQKGKLELIQCRGVRSALGYRQSTPNNVLLAEVKEIPFDIRFTYLTKNYLNRVFGSTDHPCIHILDKLLEMR